MQIPCISLIVTKTPKLVIKMSAPAIMAMKLVTRIKFLLENQWVIHFAISAPIPAPTGMHPFKTPLAVSTLILILNIDMIVMRGIVLI